jgi:hypothetical protein
MLSCFVVSCELTLCFVVSSGIKHSSCSLKATMFEDFKEKVGNLQNKHDNQTPLMSTTLAPDIMEKLRKAGIDSDNFTIEELFPET